MCQKILLSGYINADFSSSNNFSLAVGRRTIHLRNSIVICSSHPIALRIVAIVIYGRYWSAPSSASLAAIPRSAMVLRDRRK
jgi:hypothetical protein